MVGLHILVQQQSFQKSDLPGGRQPILRIGKNVSWRSRMERSESGRSAVPAARCAPYRLHVAAFLWHIAAAFVCPHITCMSNEPDRPRVERPRCEPEIIPPGEDMRRRRGTFESIFIHVEEGPDGVRRMSLKKPGPFTIVLILLGIGLAVALFFVVLSALVLLWIPIVIAGIVFAMFSSAGRQYWYRIQNWWRNR